MDVITWHSLCTCTSLLYFQQVKFGFSRGTVFFPAAKSIDSFSNVFSRDSNLSSFSFPLSFSIYMDLLRLDVFDTFLAVSYIMLYARADFNSLASINLVECCVSSSLIVSTKYWAAKFTRTSSEHSA
ncbi:hypothetical protein AVEN_55166-1 [Araneus ventricosus]|uniref:Uncharacterized protein n=1 Tax=Araneus ventricosus TaxID=182803 RepID=A0A4Y2HLF4_ARAVE|nr:hypothetical protein AVEN_55166-1 [Araneus ventricosus]